MAAVRLHVCPPVFSHILSPTTSPRLVLTAVAQAGGSFASQTESGEGQPRRRARVPRLPGGWRRRGPAAVSAPDPPRAPSAPAPRPRAPRPARTDLPAAARGRVPTAAPRPWRRRRAAARCPTAGAAPGPSAGGSSQPVLIAAPAPPAAQTPAGATWVGPAALGAPRRRGPGCAAAPARRGRLCAPAAPLPARPPRLPASPAPDGLAPWPPLIEVPPPPASRRHQGLDHSPPIS